MEIPAKGEFLAANSTKGAGKAHLDVRLGKTPRHPHAWSWISSRGAGSANSCRYWAAYGFNFYFPQICKEKLT
jgi:hypothetical protein